MLDLSPIILIAAPARTDRHRLSGTVTVDGLPAAKNVVVLQRATLQLLGIKGSDPATGAWEISGLPEYPMESLLVMALNADNTANAEVADHVSQVTGA